MSKVNIEVIEGVVDGNPVGSLVKVDKRSAEYLEKRGYVKIIEEVKKKKTKKASAPKKSSKSTSKKKKESAKK